MNKKSARKLIIVIPVSLLFIFCLFFITENTDVTSISVYLRKREAKVIIDKVEEYKKINNRYPQKLSDIGLPEPDESGPFFYDLLDSESYQVWFGWRLGESIIYDSRTKKWRSEG